MRCEDREQIPILVAGVIVLIALLLIGCQPCVAAPTKKPKLLYFKSQGCEGCLKFKRDSELGETGLMAWLKSNFQITTAIDVSQRNDLARQYQIQSLPTFIVCDGNTEIGRVSGYENPQSLMRRLSALMRWQRPAPQQTPNDPIVRNDSEQIRKANEALQKRNRELEDAAKIAKAEAEAERRRVKALEEIRERLKAETEASKQRAELPAAPEYEGIFQEVEQDQQSNDPSPPAEPAEKKKPTSDIVETASEVLSSKWARALLVVAAPEVAIPGSVGLAALGAAAGWVSSRRKKRRAASQPATRSAGRAERKDTSRTVEREYVVDAPPTPPRHRIETQFVAVDCDSYQRAHEQARQHVARRYPGSQEVLEAELSLTRQFLAGQS